MKKGENIMSKSFKNEFFDYVNVDDAKALLGMLNRNRLTTKWLIHRLNRDFGIKVNTSYLSQVMNGKREIGPKTQRLIWCAHRVIEEYESFYKGR